MSDISFLPGDRVKSRHPADAGKLGTVESVWPAVVFLDIAVCFIEFDDRLGLVTVRGYHELDKVTP